MEKENHRAGWRLRQIFRFLAKISVPPADGGLHKKFLNLRKFKFVYALRYARKFNSFFKSNYSAWRNESLEIRSAGFVKNLFINF